MLPIRPLARALLGSFAKMTPVFFIKAAMCVVLPPGAAAIYVGTVISAHVDIQNEELHQPTSRQRSFSWGASAMTGRKEDAA